MELHYVGISAAFDPYAQARPVGRCAECGAALYDGDRVYYGRGTDHKRRRLKWCRRNRASSAA